MNTLVSAPEGHDQEDKKPTPPKRPSMIVRIFRTLKRHCHGSRPVMSLGFANEPPDGLLTHKL